MSSPSSRSRRSRPRSRRPERWTSRRLRRPTAIDLLVAAGLVDSRSAARRAVNEGGAYLNNTKIVDAEAAVTPAAALVGGWLVLRRGKRSVAGVRLT